MQVELRAGDMSYAAFLAKADAQEQVLPYVAEAYDTCNILFSSGTTGGLQQHALDALLPVMRPHAMCHTATSNEINSTWTYLCTHGRG